MIIRPILLFTTFLFPLVLSAWDASREDGLSAMKLIKKFANPEPLDGSQEEVRPALRNGPDRSPFPIMTWCMEDEREFESIRRSVLLPWEKSWMAKDAESFFALAVNGFQTSALNFKKESKRNLGGIELSQNTQSVTTPLLEKEAAKDAINKFLKSFASVSDVEITGYEILSPAAFRDSKKRMNKAHMLAYFDVRGFGPAQKRMQDRGRMRIALQKDGDWKISKIELLKHEHLESSRAPAFADITDSTGVDSQLKTYLRREAIRRGGYALAAGDYNNDGKGDLLVGTEGETALFKGNGKGGFERVKVPGLDENSHVKSAAFADFDSDGKQDILIVRFDIVSEGKNNIYVLRNLGGDRFNRIAIPNDDAGTNQAMPMTVADFNNDGKLDFYVGFPGAKDFTFLEEIYHDPKVRVQGLYYNTKDFKFESHNLPEMYVKNNKKINFGHKVFAHSAMAVDYDRDGKMDIIVVDDRGNVTPMYRNLGSGRFEQVADNIGILNSAFGMGAAAADLFGEGLIDFVITNVDLVSQRRVQSSCRKNWNGLNGSHKAPGIRLYRAFPGGKYAEVTDISGLDWVGDGAAGVEIVDYNLDGKPDIVVSTGLWTGTDKNQDLSSYFARVFWNGEGESQHTAGPHSDFMKAMIGFKGDIETLKEGPERLGLAGNQHKRLFRNIGGGQFVEVGFFEGIDSLADGYVVSRADLFGSGQPDLIFRNGDPGSEEVKFPPVQVFKNENPEKNKALKVVLIGTQSNPDAIGAEVEVTTKSGKLYQQLMGNNGSSQSEKALFFGLGKQSVAKRVAVRWPSGLQQVLKNVKAGTVTITESTSMQAER